MESISLKRSSVWLALSMLILVGCGVGTSGTSGSGASPVSTTTVSSASLTYPVVDTNQTSCYDTSTGNATTCTGTGYDADYDGYQPSYTVSADGKVVTDNITRLSWTQSTDINSDGVVDDGDKMYQSAALSYCGNLTLDGYKWRLPNIKELYSLAEYSGSDPASYTGTDTSVLTPFLSPVFDWAFGQLGGPDGDRIIDAQYATSTIYVSTTMLGNPTMFGMNFVDGRIKGYPMATKQFYVRCVTGNPSYGINQFVDNGDGTITDKATDLMWEQNDHTSLTFDQAVSTCENATTAGYKDWRLPNAKELQSIFDYSNSPDTTSSAAIDTTYFNATPITNEAGNTDWGYYWTSTTHAKLDGSGTDAVYDSFGRALGYFDPGTGSQQILDVHGAGAQRSDNKVSPADIPGVQTATVGGVTFYYFGPQGDIRRSANMVRCVRD